ncbi:MAG: hypothetical protein AAGG51_29825 [Cyanobacteria bacterium P01_G01_bin.54]
MTLNSKSINTQLIGSLVQIIQSLSEPEKRLLNRRLNPQRDWMMTKHKLQAVQGQFRSQAELQPLDVAQMIRQDRDNRIDGLMDSCFLKY